MNEIINYVPRIINKDKNASSISYVLKGDDKFKELRNGANKRVDKLLELIQFALKQRFNQLQRAFKFFDVQNRGRINFTNFLEGIENLNIRILKEDARLVFNYLDVKKYCYLTLESFITLYDLK